MKFMPSIVDEDEVRLLNRKGGAAMAIFKVVTVMVVLYCGQSIYRGQDPSTFALAYLAFAGTVLGIFTGGNAVDKIHDTKAAIATAPAAGAAT